ncbi:MAG: fibronectin type III domain-containing protein, partial [Deltaproteobacteria bacterium]|nr:fibronectin type III domain-containing protein [Deltaproteobacteria bacterium]
MKSRFARLLPKRFVVLVALIIVILPGIPNAYSAQITLAWSPNDEPDLAGYRLFCRQEGHSYNYDLPIWQGTATSCTIADLDDDTRYCFVVRALDSSQNESGDSNEACWQYSPAPTTLESLSISGPDSVSEGSTGSYAATARFSDGSSQ